MTIRILIIDDNEDFCAQAKIFLEARKHEVWVENDGHNAYETLEKVQPDIVVLDVQLLGHGDKTGFRICTQIAQTERYKTKRLGIILISKPYHSESDQIEGLVLGANDFLPKPFGLGLFETKICTLYSLLSINQQNTNVIEVGSLIIELDSRTVAVDGQAIEEKLANREFELLEYLASPPNTVRKRYDMLEDVWKDTHFEFGVVDRCIHGIRSKISPHERERFIETVHQVGYKLKTDG